MGGVIALQTPLVLMQCCWSTGVMERIQGGLGRCPEFRGSDCRWWDGRESPLAPHPAAALGKGKASLAGTRLRRTEGSGPALVPLTKQLGGQQLSVSVCVCVSVCSHTTCAQPHPEAGGEGDAAVPE